MQIIEVKNNLVRINYDTSLENLILSGFVMIKDQVQSFIAQVVHLEANSKGNFAIVKLLFNFNDEGVITKYNGSIPALDSIMDTLQPQELLGILPAKQPIVLGELAQQNTVLKLDGSLFEDKLLVCCENQEDKDILTENLVTQLFQNEKKLLIVDLNGNLDFVSDKIVAGENFRLPLNYDSINFIYNGLEDASAEAKALVQEVFLEVQEYVKTLPEGFIPFESFKSVVDSQYEEMELTELLLLKNKLLKYYEEGIFAQQKQEFELLNQSLTQEQVSVLDLSKVDENIQKEFVSFAYSLMEKLDEEIYVIFNVEDENSDKKLLKQIYTSKKIRSTVICPYTYKYLKELKQLSKNIILFAPLQPQNDFAGYNVFLSKLNAHEFVIYGQATQHMPLIVKLERLFKESVEVPAASQTEMQSQVQEEVLNEDLLDEQIKQDVDQFYTARQEELPQMVSMPLQPQVEEEFDAKAVEDELTDEDLDFIGDLNAQVEEQVQEEEFSVEVLPDEEPFVQEEPGFSESPQEVTDSFVEPTLQDFVQEEGNETAFYNETEPVIEQPAAATFSEILQQEAEIQQEPPAVDILPASMSSTPIVPIYSADVEAQVQSDELEQGDIVVHPKYGRGTVEKLISYGAKTLCSINFDNVGRRLLDPNLAELKKSE